jgi:peptidoglycan/xylan/chitin deacetylase (PgdA/CDA1 family)
VRRSGTVIAYHAVGPCPEASDPENLFMPVERFAEQMAYLARRHRVVPLEAVVHETAPRGSVAITFDDGFRSVLTEAAPVLRRHGFPATVFVPTGWLGSRASWYDAPGCETDVMDADELRRLPALGVDVGSHGHRHIDFSRAAPTEAEADIAASVEALTELLERPPRFFAYPWGRSSEAARRAAAAAGFEAAFSIDDVDQGRWAAPRVSVVRQDGRIVFALKTSGRYLTLRRSRLGSGGYSLVKPVVRRLRKRRLSASADA